MTKSKIFSHQLRTMLAAHEPFILEQMQPQAAVLVPIVMSPEPAVLLTVRASHLNSHPGQVSFPGGMAEPVDTSLLATALRETHEEISLAPERVDVYGKLSTAVSKDRVAVHPFVGVIEHPHGVLASPDEIADIFTVPWSFFADQAPEMQRMTRHGIDFRIPHYHYQNQHIWGLTAMILLELVNLLEGTDWPLPDYRQLVQG